MLRSLDVFVCMCIFIHTEVYQRDVYRYIYTYKIFDRNFTFDIMNETY